jgi:hypothetical protein
LNDLAPFNRKIPEHFNILKKNKKFGRSQPNTLIIADNPGIYAFSCLPVDNPLKVHFNKGVKSGVAIFIMTAKEYMLFRKHFF